MKTERFLIILGICLVIILAIILWMGWKGYQLQKRDLSIVTDKTEYESGGILKVKIKNNFGENICFSSCYPYLLENKNENWESYKYAECQKLNGNGSCIEARKEKAFELTLPEAPEGLHRLAIPVCIGCQNEDTFKEDARFYSNEFTIKEEKVDETTDWKTYRNEEYGFEIKYPNDWRFYEEEGMISFNKIGYEDESALKVAKIKMIEMSFLKVSNLEEAIEKTKEIAVEEMERFSQNLPELAYLVGGVKEKKIFINNIPATKISYGYAGIREIDPETRVWDSRVENYIFINKSRNLRILISYYLPYKIESESFLNQILSTFRFLE